MASRHRSGRSSRKARAAAAPAPETVSAPSKRTLAIAAAFAAVCLVIRLPGIGALPLFTDEAIYLRWAQLIADDPGLWLRVPLADPRPPVHSGLLALVVDLGSDPVVAGRILSAAAGALTVLFVVLLLEQLAGTRAALAGAVLFTLSPFLAFHQRLATSEALFVLESVVAVWLALRFPRDGLWPLGVVMGLTMGTRLVLSLALWPLLLVCIPRSGAAWKRIALAAVIALAVWSPYLLAERWAYEQAPLQELRRRVLYHASTGGTETSTGKVVGNTRRVAEWLWTYLTPPVLVSAAIAPFVAGWRSRATRVLLLWSAVLGLPLIAFASVSYSRYVLAATVPLLLLVACAAAALPLRLGAAVIVLLSLWPAHDLWLQAVRWRDQRLTGGDRSQYVSGRAAGDATEQAIAWLRGRAEERPVAILTNDEWGLPADAVWVAFARDPRVQLRHVQRGVPFDAKWSPHSIAAPVDPRRPAYWIFRGEPRFPVEALSRVSFSNAERGTVVIFRTR